MLSLLQDFVKEKGRLPLYHRVAASKEESELYKWVAKNNNFYYQVMKYKVTCPRMSDATIFEAWQNFCQEHLSLFKPFQVKRLFSHLVQDQA
jgi:hypothetical protein